MSRYLEVFGLLKRQMNGAVSGAMAEHGLKYSMNYGVSLPTIKSIAQPFAFDHELAADLYRQEIREMKIAAIYIENPNMVTLEQAEKWSEKWETAEIAQLCAMELFWKSTDALKIASDWFDDPNQLKHLAACHIIGKIAPVVDQNTLEPFITETNNAFALREIYKSHPDQRPKIKQLADQVDDLAWQLDYI